MKNTHILAALLTLGATGTLSAQDLIVKRDASQVEARVLEISPEQIRYKRFSNPDGPTYVLPVGDVAYIRYTNGETDTFGPVQPTQPEQPTTPPIQTLPAPQPSQPVAPVPSAQPAPTVPPTPPAGYVQRRYNIGDFYEADGVRGVVCQVTDDGTHGLLVSLDEIYLHWSEFTKGDLRTVGADDSDDGRVNMERVAAYIAANGGSWADFPAFKWCREQGDGWYLPAVNEILAIGNNFNGGTRLKFDRQARNRFNNTLKEHGGKRMDRLVAYFSSTEKDEKSAYTSHMDLTPPFVNEIPKYQKFLVRAVRRF